MTVFLLAFTNYQETSNLSRNVIGYAYIGLIVLLFVLAVPLMVKALWQACFYSYRKRRYEKRMEHLGKVHTVGKSSTKKYK